MIALFSSTMLRESAVKIVFINKMSSLILAAGACPWGTCSVSLHQLRSLTIWAWTVRAHAHVLYGLPQRRLTEKICAMLHQTADV